MISKKFFNRVELKNKDYKFLDVIPASKIFCYISCFMYCSVLNNVYFLAVDNNSWCFMVMICIYLIFKAFYFNNICNYILYAYITQQGNISALGISNVSATLVFIEEYPNLWDKYTF
ncbi:hypothetical protein DMUE_0642 [Dictyocoela muelleri]|nr:hypothetical protein DMUE_0642 [Dictyocoela muelleri]